MLLLGVKQNLMKINNQYNYHSLLLGLSQLCLLWFIGFKFLQKLHWGEAKSLYLNTKYLFEWQLW